MKLVLRTLIITIFALTSFNASAQEEAMMKDKAMMQDSDEPCAWTDWGNRVSGGAPIWFFDDEGTEVGGGVYFDMYNCQVPINLRVGAEVTHMDANQTNALSAAEPSKSNAELTFVRIPFAIEYVVGLGEGLDLFLGGGPDIINSANDISDTSVGLHLSGRLMYLFDDHFGVTVEAGYMWGDIDTNEAGDVNLDNAFIIPALVYQF